MSVTNKTKKTNPRQQSASNSRTGKQPGVVKSQSKSNIVSDQSVASSLQTGVSNEQKTSRKSMGASKHKVKSELTLIKGKMRNSWFYLDKYDTSRMKHPKKVKKELPDNAEIFCIKCNEVFLNSDELVSHEKQCFKGRRYLCEFQGGCECTFLQKSLMHQHLKVVHFDDLFKCKFCTQTFVYKKSLDTHLNKLHDQKDKQDFKYRCSQCEKATDDLTEFQTHMNRH